jgi:hypothetical protein
MRGLHHRRKDPCEGKALVRAFAEGEADCTDIGQLAVPSAAARSAAAVVDVAAVGAAAL